MKQATCLAVLLLCILSNTSVTAQPVNQWVPHPTALSPSPSSSSSASPDNSLAPTTSASTASIHFDELSFRYVNGVSLMGATFTFKIGGLSSTDAFFNTTVGPGESEFIQPPNLEGNSNGTLTVSFNTPTSLLTFGIARNIGERMSPGVTVQLFDQSNQALGTYSARLTVVNGFAQGQFSYSGTPAKTAVITFPFPGANRFAIDNLTFATTDTRLAGIDISHHQTDCKINGRYVCDCRPISWPAVAADGIAFVYAKATEGQQFVDCAYLPSKAGAESAGIKFGAFHFADPDQSAGSAVLEADHFLSTAALSSGNLIPALDLEKSNGISPTELTTWVRAWLEEVYFRTGVKPVIYSYPAFWKKEMANTTWFADNGYSVFWIAHYRVAIPSVPANNWGGQGWTFWQWTDRGTVDGISGYVDLDLYKSSAFAANVVIP